MANYQQNPHASYITNKSTTKLLFECELLSVESEQTILLNALIVYYFNETVNQMRYQCINCYTVNQSHY